MSTSWHFRFCLQSAWHFCDNRNTILSAGDRVAREFSCLCRCHVRRDKCNSDQLAEILWSFEKKKKERKRSSRNTHTGLPSYFYVIEFSENLDNKNYLITECNMRDAVVTFSKKRNLRELERQKLLFLFVDIFMESGLYKVFDEKTESERRSLHYGRKSEVEVNWRKFMRT